MYNTKLLNIELNVRKVFEKLNIKNKIFEELNIKTLFL